VLECHDCMSKILLTFSLISVCGRIKDVLFVSPGC
jgi:hypothetical protein